MKTPEIEKAAKNLQTNFPLIGHTIRMAAIKKLTNPVTAETIPHVVAALKLTDGKVAEVARAALLSLKNQGAIDAFCNAWLKTRDKTLDEILATTNYVAEKPLETKVATALKAGKFSLCDNETSVEFLVKFLSDKETAINQNAKKALLSFKNQGAVELLCEGIINGTFDKAQDVAIEAKFQPKAIARRCLFFVITGQVEKYLELDFEFQYLRPEYQAAPENIQQRVRAAIQQSNDNRLMGLFGEVRKKFVAKELTEHEAELMLDVYARNRQMEEIFALLFFAPISLVVKVFDVLSHAGWQPADDDRRELMNSLIAARKTLSEKPPLPSEPEVALGPVFQKWIETGRKEYKSKTEEQLREYLNTGIPPEAVAALSALVAQNLLKPTDHEALIKHPHWMVRMAYIALGNIKPETIFADNPVSMEGGEHWIKSMAPHFLSKTFFQLKPVSLTPDRLQQLSTAINKAGKDTNSTKNWAMLLVQLAGYTLRNTIAIGSYEKQIEDTAISI